MTLARYSDTGLAAIVGTLLTAIAATLATTIRVFPGGFEAQAVWGFVLLPGELVAAPLSDLLTLSHGTEEVVFYALRILCSWPWYWLVGYCIVKLLRRAPKSWDGF